MADNVALARALNTALKRFGRAEDLLVRDTGTMTPEDKVAELDAAADDVIAAIRAAAAE